MSEGAAAGKTKGPKKMKKDGVVCRPELLFKTADAEAKSVSHINASEHLAQ
jgi:hypothetical protein